METVKATLVKGRFYGEDAKSVEAHASTIGSYVILDRDRDMQGKYVIAAFWIANDRPIPDHLHLLTPYEIKQVAKTLNK